MLQAEDDGAAEDASDTCSQCSSTGTSRQGKFPRVHQGRAPSKGQAGHPRGSLSELGAVTEDEGTKVAWNPAVQAAPSFNRLQQMACTISELQAEVALWKRSSQVTSLSHCSFAVYLCIGVYCLEEEEEILHAKTGEVDVHAHAQGAHQEMKKLFRSLKEKGTIISRLESQLSTGF